MTKSNRQFVCNLVALILCTVGGAQAQPGPLPCSCDFSDLPGVIWWGSDNEMTVSDLAAYAAPVIWFSPDEPSLDNAHGTRIMAPEPFPFQEANGPVMYYQITKIVRDARTENPAFTAVGSDLGAAVIDLDHSAVIRLEFYAYFADEMGFGAHQHDVEVAEYRIAVGQSDGEYLEDFNLPQCGQRHYVLMVTRVTGKAHGIEWYWNVLDVDKRTRFPLVLLVEEGKHALATDKNADGYYTPSFDVNLRVNDAWGVRDIISSGDLYSGSYRGWMTKVRHPQDRVLPPLPADSPLKGALADRQEEYTRGNAVYELSPLPTVAEAEAWDIEQGAGSNLRKYLVDKEVPDGPKQEDIDSLDEAIKWLGSDALKRSFSLSAYTDGRWGFSWSFPFFIGKNLQTPVSGGYVVHRMYLKGHNLRDFGWTLLYTNSASRWIDPYLAAGVEWHDTGINGEVDVQADFVLDLGLKFRTQVGTTPLKFLTFFTDFWGLRLGFKNYGGSDIDHLTYIMEIGAGAF